MTETTPEPVIITGAAQGLGQALARAFYKSGYRVLLMDVDGEGLERLCSELGERAVPYCLDLSDADATQRAVGEAVAQYGTIKTLIHNAAILIPEPFESLSFERWQRTVNVGIQAAYLLTKALWEGMKRSGGCIMYVSSRSGIEGFSDESAYCTAKHGLEGLMKCLAMEGEEHGIYVHTLTPGMYMHTPMSERNYTDELKKRWVDPIELTPAFLYLASRPDASLSGQRLNAWDLSQAGRLQQQTVQTQALQEQQNQQ